MLKKIKKKIKSLFPTKADNSIDIEKSFIQKFLPVNPIIIDCGAHIGIDSVALSTIKGSKIFAIEPLEHLYKQLISNTAHLTNIKCSMVALNDFDGKAEMYVSSGDSDASSSLLKPLKHLEDHPDVLFNHAIQVNCLTLDSWALQHNIEKIDLLWLDMQGAELKMLKASEKIFPKVTVVHSEVSMRETYEGVEHYESYKAFMLKHGFKVVKEAIPKGFDMGNVLFVKKSLK